MPTSSLPAANQLPDMPARAAGIRGVLYLLKQPWVLWPGLAITFALAALLVVGGVSSGNVAEMLELLWIAPLVGFGAVTVTVGPAFMLKRAVTGGARWQPDADEERLERVAANHLKNHEGRGGHVILTQRRLVFVPHRFNIQLDVSTIALDDIAHAAWRKMVSGGLPVSQVLQIETPSGSEGFIMYDAPRLAALVELLRTTPEAQRAQVAASMRGR